MSIQMHENMSYRNEELVGKLSIPTIVTRQGTRIVYQMNLMFRQITSLFDHMPIKNSKKDDTHDEIDLTVLRNRFVKGDKVQEIVQYVSENIDSYILPPISAVSDKIYSFHPYNHEEILSEMGSEYNLIQNPELIGEVLDRFDGILQGMLIVKESEFNIEIMDGNHRCASIHQLTTMGKEYKNLRIGIQIFYETDADRQRQAFVDLNTSTPIDKTLLTLFGTRDPLSVSAKETIGDNPAYAISELDRNSTDYIGFDMMSDSITKTSTSTLTLNILKNMLIKYALGESGTKKKFIKNYEIGSDEQDQLLKDFAKYLKLVFEKVEPFAKVKTMGIQSIPTLREEYVSLTGAGLYLIANIGHVAREKQFDVEKVTDLLGDINWRREVETETGKVYNTLFRTGILNETGNISNNRNAQNATLDNVLETLNFNNQEDEVV